MTIYLVNRSSTRSLKLNEADKSIISYKAWFEWYLNLFYIRISDCIAFEHDYKIKQKEKLALRSIKALLIEYKEFNQYHLWDKAHQKILHYHNVVFHEAKLINNSDSNNENKEEEELESKDIDKSDNKYVIISATSKSSKLIIERCQKHTENEEKETSENI